MEKSIRIINHTIEDIDEKIYQNPREQSMQGIFEKFLKDNGVYDDILGKR